jgi:outer membrane protein insertion porin family
MCRQIVRGLVLAAFAASVPATAAAQPAPPADVSQAAPPGQPQAPSSLPPGIEFITPCDNPVPPPKALPPTDIGPIAYVFELCFKKQGGSPFIETQTYQYYIKHRNSVPSQGVWVPYNEAAEQTLRDDFRRIWDLGFLDDFSIEVTEHTLSNGVVGKVVTYHMEERERVKIVSYEGSKQIDRTKIEEQLRDRNLTIAADSLLDERKIRQVEGVVRDFMLEKGFNAEVTHTITAVEGKTVNLTFHVNEGPKVKIRKVEWVGNSEISDGKLQKQLKENKPKGFLSFITGTGTYNAAKFEEDAERVIEYYQNRGYANVRVGQPEIKVVENTKDGKTRWVELRIPVTEGARYQFGDLDFTGNKRVQGEFLRSLYDIKPGEWYSRKKIVDGNRKAQDVYGEAGFMEFTPAPELTRSDLVADPGAALNALVPEALAGPATNGSASTEPQKPPTVDVTIHVTEGEQFFVNRIVFEGNTTTRDNVIRRELGSLVESAPFNSAALKNSIRRLNQLGYFQPLEGNERDMTVEKTPGRPNMVDVTLKLQEQNRNQLTFGAGISQYEGFFGQLAYSTSNFLGRGESLTVSLQGGERAQNYQIGFTEPFLFDRNMTGGIEVHKRSLQYIGYYTQKSTGGNLTFGVPVAAFSRMFLNYSYEEVSITDLSEALIDSSCVVNFSCSVIESLGDLSELTPTQIEVLQRNPFIYDSLLIGQGGKRTISKVVPTFIHNTVNHPIFPTFGKKLSASVDLAVLGGNTQFYKPHVEGIWFIRHTSRTTIGLRGQFEYIAPLRNTTSLPIFERLFLGGEYSVRGYDIRSIGPTVPNSLVVLGGNKSLLFNAEYQITIAQPVRVLLFYDAGQVRDFGENFVWQEDLTRLVPPPLPPLIGGFNDFVRDPDAPGTTTEVTGKTSAFKTSTGVELRFFMPVLNVPFRLIYAWNPQRGNVLDNSLNPAKSSTFRFAVGTTF